MVYRNIRDLRKDHDLNQDYIASILHVEQNTYSQYETGVIPWIDEHLETLADFYGVSVDYLMDRTNDPTPPKPIKKKK